MDIFIHQSSGKNIEEFIDKIFSLFNLKKTEERESSNYPPNNRYFIGYGKDNNLTVWDEDSKTLEEYPFVLSLKNNTHKNGHVLLPKSIDEIASILSKGGFNCFIPLSNNYWETNWDRKGKLYSSSKN